jgi:hypothetical protein
MYFLGRDNERGGGVALVLVEDRAVVALACLFDLFVLKLPGPTESDSDFVGIVVGAEQGSERECMSLAFLIRTTVLFPCHFN